MAPKPKGGGKPGKKKPLSPEDLETVEESWYKFDQSGREWLDSSDFRALWMAIKGPAAFEEDECKAANERWDPDKEKKVRYLVFVKELEEEVKAVTDLNARAELIHRLASGPAAGATDYLEKHTPSPEEATSIAALTGLKLLLKPEMLEELKSTKNPPAGHLPAAAGVPDRRRLKQSFKASNAVMLDAKDSSQLRKKHLKEMLVACLQHGHVLVIDLVDLIQEEQCNVVQAFENVQEGLYEAVLSGKVREPDYFEALVGKLGAVPVG